MDTRSLDEKRQQLLGQILKALFDECDVEAALVCDLGGNILAQEVKTFKDVLGNAAALAAGSFAATRELAGLIGESGFRSIFHRGHKTGILIQHVGGEYLILVILGENSIEGMVRLFLRKIGRQMGLILSGNGGQDVEVPEGASFEVEEKPGA